MELPLNHFKYEPLPDSDDEYSDEEYEDHDSDEQEENSDPENSRKRGMSMEPRSRKRRRLDDDNVSIAFC